MEKISEYQRLPLPSTCCPPTLGLEDALCKGQSGIVASPDAYRLPLWSCVWDPGGWGDLFYVIPGMQAWRNQDQVWEQQTKTHQRPVKCNKESVNLGHKKQRLCYLPPPNPQVIHLLGTGWASCLLGLHQPLPRLQVNHCHGPTRGRIQLWFCSAAFVPRLLL